MDWSSVFEDEGEEVGDWERTPTNSRAEILNRFGQEYTPLIGYAFTVNYILGVGCLGIPYAFLQSGIILGTIFVVALSFVSYITVLWIAAATQQELKICTYHLSKSTNPFIVSPFTSLAKRKHQLKSAKASTTGENSSLLASVSQKSFSYTLSSTAVGNGNSMALEMVSNADGGSVSGPSSGRSKGKLSRIASKDAVQQLDNQMQIRELEVIDLAEEFLGTYGKLSYQFSLMTLTYVGLLAYTQVFNDTFRMQLWPSVPTFFPPLLFGIIVIPLSCFDLSEQIVVQVIMSILRFLSLGILLIGTLAALMCDYEHAAVANSTSWWSASPTKIVSSKPTIPLIEWSGFGVMFTTAIFSQLFQHSVPGLIRPLSEENKKHIPAIFRAALITTALLYIGTGTVCVLYFGHSLNESVNLNFVGFSWGLSHDNSAVSFFVVRMLAMIVVLFPALDTLSVFPLIAITLGNNLNAAFPGLHQQFQRVLVRWCHYPENSTVTSSEAKRYAVLSWRLIAAFPPVILSILVRDLVVSLQIAGLCGIVVALVAPALLYRQTQERINLLPLAMQESTLLPFSNQDNQDRAVKSVLIVAALALLISVYQMLAI